MHYVSKVVEDTAAKIDCGPLERVLCAMLRSLVFALCPKRKSLEVFCIGK